MVSENATTITGCGVTVCFFLKVSIVPTLVKNPDTGAETRVFEVQKHCRILDCSCKGKECRIVKKDGNP